MDDESSIDHAGEGGAPAANDDDTDTFSGGTLSLIPSARRLLQAVFYVVCFYVAVAILARAASLLPEETAILATDFVPLLSLVLATIIPTLLGERLSIPIPSENLFVMGAAQKVFLFCAAVSAFLLFLVAEEVASEGFYGVLVCAPFLSTSIFVLSMATGASATTAIGWQLAFIPVLIVAPIAGLLPVSNSKDAVASLLWGWLLAGGFSLFILNRSCEKRLRREGAERGLLGVRIGHLLKLPRADQSVAADSSIEEPPSAEFRFSCDHCGQRISSEIDVSGELVECPSCSRSFRVPRLEMPQATDETAGNTPKSFKRKAILGAVSSLALLLAIALIFGRPPSYEREFLDTLSEAQAAADRALEKWREDILAYEDWPYGEPWTSMTQVEKDEQFEVYSKNMHEFAGIVSDYKTSISDLFEYSDRVFERHPDARQHFYSLVGAFPSFDSMKGNEPYQEMLNRLIKCQTLRRSLTK